ncbi:hypothetical protein [Actinophytocola sp.]|uniref:hypothetical protein n=1 Tax=Actinophytocola sp. TaxID=1872138 RepID=UPI002D808D13|nr:hypothetical protein [Actinophytocola sp.]HET9142466.1 hypothetical protein [Actinophytocola sp.]
MGPELVPRRGNRAVTAVMAAFAVAFVGVALFLMLRPGPPASGHQSHSMPPPSATVQDEGLKQVQDGFRLELITAPAGRGPAVPVTFRVLDPTGRPQLGYETPHTKMLHFYVLRDDMSQYQHLHPVLDGDSWRTTISVPDGGFYRLYTEFVPKGRQNLSHPTVLGVSFVVPGDTAFVPLPAPEASMSVDGYTVSRADGTAAVPAEKVNQLRFRITDGAGKPVEALEPYLGAYAHLSAFNSLTMGLNHQHPVGQAIDSIPGGPELTFTAQFANRGEHRLFLEFSVSGQIHRAEFTMFVT